MIEGTVIDYLKQFADLTGKVDDKFYLNRAPRSAQLPYVLIGKIGGDAVNELTNQTGTAQTILQVTAWEKDPNGPKVAGEIFKLIRDKLSGLLTTFGGVRMSCILQGEPSTFAEEPEDDSDDWRHAVTADFLITHTVDVPTHA